MSSAILKKLCLTAVLLLLLLGAYLYRQVPHGKAPFAKAAEQAEHFILEQGAKKVDLQKQGTLWKVGAGSGPFYPADEGQIKTLVSGLKDIQLEDEISDRADRAAEYEVNEESGTRVRLLGAKDAKLAEGIFGKQAPDFAHLYFRYPDKPNVYLARGMIRGELGGIVVNAWRSRQLMQIAEAKVQSVLIEGKGFKTELVRLSTDTWSVNGTVVDPAPVNNLVGTLAHFHAEDFVDPAANPELSYDHLTGGRVSVKGDSPIDLRIGPQDPKTKRYAASVSPESGVAWIPEATVKALLQKPSAFKPK